MTKSLQIAGLGIEAAAQRSGLSQHLIRIWERRYAVVRPIRTESNRRLYSEADVVRLALLNRAVHAGHRISDIATLSTPKLEQLVGKDFPNTTVSRGKGKGMSPNFVELALNAIKQFDSEELGAILSHAEVDLGQAPALDQVVMPLMEKLGEMWKDGDIRIAHEHMATAVIRNHVGSLLASMRYPANAPSIVVATPAGQLHEVGALVVSVGAALEGWRPVYLGPNLPADEIAGAVQKSNARVVALSLVFPSDDPKLPAELNRLRRLLSDKVSLLIGGRAAEAYGNAIDSVHAFRMTDIGTFRRQLDLLRSGKTTHSVQKSKGGQ
ncbi:MAG: MerR family transcriptional regulator [candidate division Zixibacteria bacterium]|nr:MerR family transcriptional regulator [candidate division Zixibacteria bacterium]